MEYTVPKCRNCHQTFSPREGKTNRLPLLLRCGHYFCSDCIEYLARMRVQDKKGVSCPECTCHTPLVYGQEVQTQLVPNLYVLGLLTAAALGLKRVPNTVSASLCMSVEQPLSKEPYDLNPPSVERKWCEECECKPATLSCLQCVGLYCDNCFKTAHAASKSMCRHTPLPVTQIGYQLKQCPGHPGETAKLYCEEDSINVCSECCRVGDHVGHSVLSFVEAAEKHSVKLRELVSMSVDNLKRLGDIEQSLWMKLSELRKDLCAKSVEISNAFTGLFVQLQRRELQLLEEVAKTTDSYTSQLVDNIKQVHAHACSLATMVSIVQGALASGSTELVVRGSQWSSELSRLCDIPWPLTSLLEPHPIVLAVEGDLRDFEIDKKLTRKLLMEIGHIEHTSQQLCLQHTNDPLGPTNVAIHALPVPRPFSDSQNVLSQQLHSPVEGQTGQSGQTGHSGQSSQTGQTGEDDLVHSEDPSQAVPLPQTILPPPVQITSAPPQTNMHSLVCQTPAKTSAQATPYEHSAQTVSDGSGRSTPNKTSAQALAHGSGHSTPTQTGPHCETGQHLIPARPSPSSTPSSPQPKSTVIPWDSAEPVTVIHVVDPSEFYIQRPEDQKALHDLTVKLDEYCPRQKHPHLRSLIHGVVYASKNTDGHWYRVRLDRVIKGASQVSVFVVYVDLGYSGMTTRDGLTTLTPELASGQHLCCKCSLVDVVPTPKFNNVAPKSWSQQCLSQFKSLVLDNPNVRMNVLCSDGYVLHVDLLLPPVQCPMSVIGRLSKMGHVVSRKKTKDKLQYPPPCASMRPGDEVEVVVSSTDSPSSFYVQLVDGYQNVTELSNQLQTEVATITPSQLINRTIGSLCLAVYSGDGMYYRAEILAVDDRDAKVVFIDYGNKDTVPIETLLILPSHYLDKPVQAIHCTLNDVCSLDPKGTWSDEVLDMFSDLTSSSVYLLVVEGKGTPLPVTLKNVQTSESVSVVLEKLAMAKSKVSTAYECPPHSVAAVPSSLTTPPSPLQAVAPSSPPINSVNPTAPETTPVPTLPPQSSPDVSISPPHLPATGAHFTATVTHIASLLDFHVVMDTQQLEQLKLTLMLHTPLVSCHASLCPGDYCLAHFTDQELWYRVRVMALVEEGLCVVQYVDYGNTATVSVLDTAPLPPECTTLPAQAIPCRLANVNLLGGTSGWDLAVGGASSTVHLFSSFVMDHVVTVTVKDCDAVMLGVSLTIGDHGDVVALMNKHGCSFQL